jgi:predicted O-methyltransferase YrrM
MLDQIKAQALIDDIPIMSDDILDVIAQLIQDNHITTILEFGTATGYSSLSLADRCDWISIDTLEKDMIRYQVALINKQRLNDQQVTMIHADAKTWPIEHFYDLVIIDAAKAQNQFLFERVLPFVKERGIVVVDNMSFHGHVATIPQGKTKRNLRQMVTKIVRFYEFIQEQPYLSSRLLDVGDGLLIIQRKKV